MTLQRLEQFEALANYRSFSKAAETLFITQSALSHAIQNLEEELETSLIELRGQQVFLTRQGELLLAYTRKRKNEQNNLRMALNDRRNLFDNPLRIQFLVGFYPQQKLINAFLLDYPDTRFQLYQAEQGRMEFYSLDLMIFTGDSRQPGTDAVFLFDDPVVLALHRDHPLASLQKILPVDLTRYPGMKMQTTCSPKTDEFLTDHGIYLSPVLETDHFQLILRMLKENQGWVLMPCRTMVPDDDPMICTRTVEGLHVSRQIFLQPVSGRYGSKIMRLFTDYCKEWFQSWREENDYE